MVLNNRLWIPRKAWKNIPKEKREAIIEKFRKVFVNPQEYCELLAAGRTCIPRDIREKEFGTEAAKQMCQECPAAQKKAICIFRNTKYVSLYRGDLEKIDAVIKTVKKYNKGIKTKDLRVEEPLVKRIKVNDTGDERSVAQNKLAQSYVDEGYGILVAAARFGKTRTALVASSLLNQRTFVLAHQVELLEQFQANWTKFSNLKKDQVKINPSVEEAKKIPVSLFTYQHFLHENGTKRLKALCKVPGLVIVDEVHRCASKGFNRIANAFHAKYRLGITATPDRKDKMSFLIYNTFGPVTAKGGSEMLSCKYKILKTGSIISDYERVPHKRRFTYINKALAKEDERNAFIAKRAVRNVEKGHKVLIPVKGVEHLQKIAKLVRAGLKKLHYNKILVCEYSAQFVKGKKRVEVSQQIRDGYFDVVVAIESMINVGFDAPRISNLILNAGSYSFNEPNMYQLFSRIRTKCEGKKTPLIDILQDECKWSEYSTKRIEKQMEEYKFTKIQPKRKKK
ncbi:MAG: DEAD/DEAH box helicase family protein [Muribaculaceae bacterium]|nr:DEAD/DEAH box helicase family protein [Muribaculaceae bacterium]